MDYGVESQSGEPRRAFLYGMARADGIGQAYEVGPSAARADGVGGAIGIPGQVGLADGVGGATAHYGWAGQADGVGGATATPAFWGRADGVGSVQELTAIPEALQFLNRTTGLDSKHINAYIALINGLVTDGVWPKLDVLYIFATKDATTALLNLVSSYYNGVNHGATFTVDIGYQGVDGSQSVYIDSTFQPPHSGTASIGPTIFTDTSNHISAWPLNNVTSSSAATSGGGCIIGTAYTDLSANPVGGQEALQIYPRQSSVLTGFPANSAWFLNQEDGTGSGGITAANAYATTTSVGHWVSNRSDGYHSQGYYNGSLVASPNTTWGGTFTAWSIYVLASHTIYQSYPTGTPPYASRGSAANLFMASIGGSLNATDVANFHSRLATYANTIVPTAHGRATQAVAEVLETYSNPTHLRSTQTVMEVLRTQA